MAGKCYGSKGTNGTNNSQTFFCFYYLAAIVRDISMLFALPPPPPWVLHS